MCGFPADLAVKCAVHDIKRPLPEADSYSVLSNSSI